MKYRVSIANVETVEQSKLWLHTHSPNKQKGFKQTFSARKMIATAFWYKRGELILEFMQQRTSITLENEL
jgi:hypothetical protein